MADTHSPDDGGPVFPGCIRRGATLRDLFASEALHGMLAGPTEQLMAVFSLHNSTSEALALAAYDIADAMLRARQRQGGEL
jgi:hypothetical protein